jgi:RHS repeat-associated protein
VADFIYNGLDDRVATTRGTETRRFVYDRGGRVLGEYGAPTTDVKAEYIWLSPEVGEGEGFGGGDGYMPLAVSVPGMTTGTTQLTWVHGSHMGVPLVTTNASGTAVTPSGYNVPGFPGQSRTLADLYYNRYRDYDTVTGRYIQADPIGLDGDANPYAYAMGNPLRYVDPVGLAKVYGFDPWTDNGLARASLNDRDRRNMLTFYGHGNPESSAVKTREGWKSPKQFLDYISRNGWKKGMPIWLKSCQSGRPGGFADQLAGLSGSQVYASAGNVWYDTSWWNPHVIGPQYRPFPRKSGPMRPGAYRQAVPTTPQK